MNAPDNSSRLLPVLLNDLLVMAAILAIGFSIGAAINWKMIRGAWAGEYALEAESAETEATGVQTIALAEVQSLLEQKKALAVDARREFFYAKEHIAEAVALPLAQVDARLDAFLQQVPKDRLLITYCSGYGCEDSHDLALKLKQAGYQRVRVFSGGLPEWKQAGLSTQGTDVTAK
jgi:rhodanese-related sulfurtransferase